MPTFIDGKNFSGHGVSCLKLPQFRQFIIDNLAMELALLPDAIIVPLGKVVDQVLEFLREEKRIDLAQTWRAFRIRRV